MDVFPWQASGVERPKKIHGEDLERKQMLASSSSQTTYIFLRKGHSNSMSQIDDLQDKVANGTENGGKKKKKELATDVLIIE